MSAGRRRGGRAGGQSRIRTRSANMLLGSLMPFCSSRGMNDGRTPVARLGHSIEVFDITGDADAHRALARLYRRFGRPDLATTEEARVEAR